MTARSATIIDGPFAETKELIGGYTIIRVDSREEALEWARRFPNPAGEGNPAEVEVRQMFELDDFEPTNQSNVSGRSTRSIPPAVVCLHRRHTWLVNDGQAAIDFYQRAFSVPGLARPTWPMTGKRFMARCLDSSAKGRLFLHDEFPRWATAAVPNRRRQLEGASCTFHLDVSDADFGLETGPRRWR